MLSYKEYDNAQAVEIVLSGRVSTEEFDKVARKLETFIERHGEIRVLEVIKDFEGMDAGAFWHDVKFSLRHVQDFSRIAIVTNPDVHHLWSSLVAPFMRCDVEHFSPGEMACRDGRRRFPLRATRKDPRSDSGSIECETAAPRDAGCRPPCRSHDSESNSF